MEWQPYHPITTLPSCNHVDGDPFWEVGKQWDVPLDVDGNTLPFRLDGIVYQGFGGVDYWYARPALLSFSGEEYNIISYYSNYGFTAQPSPFVGTIPTNGHHHTWSHYAGPISGSGWPATWHPIFISGNPGINVLRIQKATDNLDPIQFSLGGWQGWTSAFGNPDFWVCLLVWKYLIVNFYTVSIQYPCSGLTNLMAIGLLSLLIPSGGYLLHRRKWIKS